MRYHLGKALLETEERMESNIMRKGREIRVYFIKLPGTFHCKGIRYIKADDAVPDSPRIWHVYSLKG
jgi:hypothetical protein